MVNKLFAVEFQIFKAIQREHDYTELNNLDFI